MSERYFVVRKCIIRRFFLCKGFKIMDLIEDTQRC